MITIPPTNCTRPCRRGDDSSATKAPTGFWTVFTLLLVAFLILNNICILFLQQSCHLGGDTIPCAIILIIIYISVRKQWYNFQCTCYIGWMNRYYYYYCYSTSRNLMTFCYYYSLCRAFQTNHRFHEFLQIPVWTSSWSGPRARTSCPGPVPAARTGPVSNGLTEWSCRTRPIGQRGTHGPIISTGTRTNWESESTS